MLEIARKSSCKFILFSSSEIYGDPSPEHIPIKESFKGYVSSMGPRACYDEGKRTAETLCYIYNQYFNVHTNVIRPFNVYGPGMQENDYRVMPNFAFAILKDKPLEMYGSGLQTRTYCYITDAIVGFINVFLNGVNGEPYNIGNREPEISVLQLAQTFKDISKKEVQFHNTDYPDTYPADEPNRRCPDIKKAYEHLDYKPLIPLETGVSRFLNWVLAEKKE